VSGQAEKMTITHRRILYIIFFIIFFIAAPITIMWAQGYKFDWRNKSWQKTGVLFLEVKPEKANIYLNDKFYDEKTSARIKNLLPKKYNIKIEKDGYITWEKNLEIYPSMTTFAQYIRLFKQDLPTINLLNNKIILVSEQKNNSIAIITQENEIYGLYILNIEKQVLDKITEFNIQPEKIFLSQQAEKILIQELNSWTIIDAATKKIIKLNDYLSLKELNISKPVFDSTDSNILYAISPNGLEKINLVVPETIIVIADNIISFSITNNNLYYLREKDKNFELISTNLNSLQPKEIISNLPISQNYDFYPAPDGLINLIDSQNQILYIFDSRTKISPDKKTTIPGVKYINWHKNNSLLFINDYEIWTYQKHDDQYTKNLITRLSSKINFALWFTYDTHLLYLTNNGLYITEVVTNNNEVIKYEKIKIGQKAYLTKKGEKLIWLTDNSIYESELQ